jgi:mono/diheme cytochrome c family protein
VFIFRSLIRNQNVKKIVSPVLLAALILFVLNTAASPAGVSICGPRGEVLYKRHCSACHLDAAKLKAVKNIVEIIRYPPAVMPDFDKDKISDRGVQEIADYIYNGSDFRVRSKK